MSGGYIPVVDFSAFSLKRCEDEVEKEALEKLSQEVFDALANVGFMYIINHGFNMDLIQIACEKSDKFYALDGSIKEKYARSEVLEQPHGWTNPGRMISNQERPPDNKETFSYAPHGENRRSPDDIVPGFSQAFEDIFNEGFPLMLRVLQTMAIGLGLDRYFFDRNHKIQDLMSVMNVRYPVPKKALLPGQIWCGEHTDFGSITFVFQDQTGGLQILDQSGTFIDATPVPGSIVVNIGDLMQRWTADKLKSNVHRVLPPSPKPDAEDSFRHSVVLFGQPDAETLCTCLDGSNEYPPITSLQHFKDMFNLFLLKKK